MKILPAGDNIYYEWLELDEKWGDIMLPADREQRTRKAVVIEVGSECKYLKKGDKILISCWTGAHLFLALTSEWDVGQRHRLCRESEVMATYED